MEKYFYMNLTKFLLCFFDIEKSIMKYIFNKTNDDISEYNYIMEEVNSPVMSTPPGKKLKQARLPFAPVNKQKGTSLEAIAL